MKIVKILWCAALLICCHQPELNDLEKIDASDMQLTVTGHRGAAGFCPENTLSSIEKALTFKVDRVEIDVQQTKDEVVVLLHDKTVNRTTTGSGNVKDFSYKELSKLKILNTFDPEAASEHIPTLDAAIKAVAGKSILLIEIKEGNSYYPNIEKNILKLIKANNAQDWCIIHSFNDEVLEKVHQLNPTIRLHKLFLNTWFYDFDRLPFVEEYSVNYYFTSRSLVNKIHGRNKKINVWTVNDKKKVKKLIDLKVDGVITDFPNIVN